MRIALLFPELLGTYGDGGNALVLAHRARLRGVRAEIVEIRLGEDVPTAEIYLLGGGEDGPQRLATDALRRDGSLGDRVSAGAQLLAVCAGFQILGLSFAVAGAGECDGLGLLRVSTTRGDRRRVGALAVDVGGRTLVGFENHGGETDLGEEAALGEVLVGHGDDGVSDGARHGHLWATYAHGPVTALNPWFADEIIGAALGTQLDPVPSMADRLHAARCAAVLQARSRRP